MALSTLYLQIIEKNVRLSHFIDARPVKLLLEPLEDNPSYGDIYSGRIVSHDYSRAWVDIRWIKPALLNLKGRKFNDGDPAVVSVKRDPIRERYRQKPPLLKLCDPKILKDLDPGLLKKAPLLLKKASPPWLEYLETLSEDVSFIITDESLFRSLREKFPSFDLVLQRMTPLPRDVDEAWEETLMPVIPLPYGGVVLIEEGDTLTAIDVNTTSLDGIPASLRHDDDLADFISKTAKIISEALSLRRIGGLVVIDFPRLKRYENRQKMTRILKERFSSTGITPLGFTKAGLYELILEQRGPSLLRRAREEKIST